MGTGRKSPETLVASVPERAGEGSAFDPLRTLLRALSWLMRVGPIVLMISVAGCSAPAPVVVMHGVQEPGMQSCGHLATGPLLKDAEAAIHVATAYFTLGGAPIEAPLEARLENGIWYVYMPPPRRRSWAAELPWRCASRMGPSWRATATSDGHNRPVAPPPISTQSRHSTRTSDFDPLRTRAPTAIFFQQLAE